MKNQNKIAKQNQQSNSIYQENLQRARAILNFKFNLLKLSIITSFASILLMYSGKVPPEKVETAQGIINGIVSLTFKVTKDGNDKLNNENKD